MATQTINFNNAGNYYYSDPIEVTGTSAVINVKFANPGGLTLERSITGADYIYAKTINPSFRTLVQLEQGISGCVPGQFLRLRFEGGAKPESITVLQ